MENILLWFLRTLLVALLALGFALPVVRTGRFAALGAARRDVAIVWDVSASMTYESGGRNIWNESCEAVLDILRGLTEGDRAAVVLAAERVEPLVPRPNADLAFIANLVQEQRPSPTGSSLMPALQTAVDALSESGAREREYYIITDGQARAWEGLTPSPTPKAEAQRWNPSALNEQGTLIVALLGAERPSNRAPVDAELRPGLLLEGQSARLAVRILRSDANEDTPVTLHVNGREVSRHIVPAGATSGEAVFSLPPLEPGRHAIIARTASDGLFVDDAFHLLVDVRDRIPVVCVGEQADLLFVRRALQPGERESGIEVRAVSLATWDGSALDRALAVLLVNAVPLPGPALVDLERFLRAGGVIAIFPGDRASPDDYANLTWLPARPHGIEDVRAHQGLRTLRLRTPSDPLFEDLRLPPGTVPTLAVRRWLTLGIPAPNAETLISMDLDTPFLVARSFEGGRVFLFTVSADRNWSSLPLTPIFLPLLHQIARHGAQLAREPLWHVSAHEMTLPVTMAAVPERLLDSEGNPVMVRTVRRDGRDIALVEQPLWPGIYSADFAGARRLVLAVNLPGAESDLTPIDPDDLSQQVGVRRIQIARTREELARKIHELRVGRPLGELVLWLALGIGLAEFLLANHVSRRTAVRRMKWIVEPSGRMCPTTPS